MTDGQLYLSTPLFGEGQRPAVDLGLSVSRVGSKVQWKAIKKLSGALRLEYLQYREVLRVSRLKTSGQSEEAEEQLKKGAILGELMKQDRDMPVQMESLVVILYAYNNKLLHELMIPEVILFQYEIYDYFMKRKPEIFKRLRKEKEVDDEMTKAFDEVLKEYIADAKAKRPKDEFAEDEEDSNVGVDVLDQATTKQKDGEEQKKEESKK
jgi:F-type H+-transporting ATPase subunit alpha